MNQNQLNAAVRPIFWVILGVVAFIIGGPPGMIFGVFCFFQAGNSK